MIEFCAECGYCIPNSTGAYKLDRGAIQLVLCRDCAIPGYRKRQAHTAKPDKGVEPDNYYRQNQWDNWVKAKENVSA